MSPVRHKTSARAALPIAGSWPASLLLLISAACATASRQPLTPVAASAQTASTPSPQPRPIRALYVTGGGFHDFVALQSIVPPGIAARTNIVWTIDRTADTSTTALIARHQNTKWADEFD